jgi:Fe-S cluster assembly protein SufD
LSAALQAFRSQRDVTAEPLPALAERRARAFERFEEQGLPTTKHEDWRFTSLRPLLDVAFAARAADFAPDAGILDRAHGMVGDASRWVTVNGVHRADLSTPGSAVGPLTDLGDLCDEKTRPFAALNTALFRDGAVIDVPAGTTLDAPIHLLHIVSGQDGPVAVHPRHSIRVGEGARAVIVEHTLGIGDGADLTNSVTEIHVARGAEVEHVSLQDASPSAFQVSTVVVRQEADSRFGSHSIALGAKLARFELALELAGEGAHAGARGLYLGRARQLLDQHLSIDHATPHTTSEQIYKGVLDDEAIGVFHGRIHVRPHAQKIDARQTNRNLLLSNGARAHSKPQLEIYADDVRCSHGATIGQLDLDQLFYLRSRGIELADARALLTLGFASEVTQSLPVESLRDALGARVLEWLPRGGKR